MYERWLIDIPVFFIKTRTYIISKTRLHFGLSSANQLLTVTSMFSFGFYPIGTDYSFFFITAQIIPPKIHVMSLSSWYEWNFMESIIMHSALLTIRNLVQKAHTSQKHVTKKETIRATLESPPHDETNDWLLSPAWSPRTFISELFFHIKRPRQIYSSFS